MHGALCPVGSGIVRAPPRDHGPAIEGAIFAPADPTNAETVRRWEAPLFADRRSSKLGLDSTRLATLLRPVEMPSAPLLD
eukprot:9048124-Pyramimonas_sp.AAC.1